jgi:Arc/MetJ-type ribon-helix-helix transcriptional regulator
MPGVGDIGIPYDDRMHDKVRLTASIDPEQLAAAREAVAAGRAASVSAWVNEAMRRQAEIESKLAAMAGFISAYEAEHGVITEDEMRDARRSRRSRAIVVRGPDS